jgi:outer membrane protein assembly factor BamB
MDDRALHGTRRATLRAGALGLAGSFAGCAALSEALDGTDADVREWSSYGHDVRYTGHVRDYTAPPDDPDRLWTFDTAFRSTGAQAVGRETVFGVAGHRLYAIDRLDGTVRWTQTVGTWGGEAPVLVGCRLYVGTSGSVVAVSATDGETAWEHDVNGGVFAPPAVADDRVFAGSNGPGTVIAIEGGDEEWTFDTGLYTVSGPAVVDGTVYVGTWSGHPNHQSESEIADAQALYALDADGDGEEWSFDDLRGGCSVPAVADGTVYVTCGDDRVYAVDADSGEKDWDVEVSLNPGSAPAVVEGVVYVGSTDGSVYALDADDGSEVYRVEVAGPVEYGIAVVDEVAEESQYEGHRQRLVYASTAAGTVDVLKTETRELLASVDLGAPLDTPPAVRGRLIHVGMDDGNVHVLGR